MTIGKLLGMLLVSLLACAAAQAQADIKKCASLPPEVRVACEASAASARKSCEDKSCAAAKPK